MAIYKSSFNKQPEKKEKQKEEKEIKEKVVKPKKKFNYFILILTISLLVLFVCILPSNIFKRFFLGLIGLSVYPITILLAFFSSVKLMKKRYAVHKKYVVYLSTALLIVWFIFHLILTSKIPTDSYGEYLLKTYSAKTTAGGLVFSLLSYFMVKYLTYVGSYIVCAILLAVFVGLIVDYIAVTKKLGQGIEKKSKFDFEDIEEFEIQKDEIKEMEEVEELSPEEKARKLAKQKLGLEKSESTIISSSMPTYDINLKQEKPLSKREYILTPLEPVIPADNSASIFEKRVRQVNNIRPEQVMTEEIKQEIKQPEVFENTQLDEPEEIDEPIADDIIMDESVDLEGYETAFETSSEIDEDDLEDLNEDYDDSEDVDDSEDFEEVSQESDDADESEDSGVQEITPDYEEEHFDEYADNKFDDGLGSTVDTEVVRPSIDISKFNIPKFTKKTEEQPKEEKVKEEIPPYIAPPVEILKYMENPVQISEEKLHENIDRLEQVLEDFKVPAKVNNVQVGPAVTRYELTMPRGISVNKIAQMADDIAMTLASNGAIRVEAPIPGKNSVGIEVPNEQVSPVSLRELIDSDEFKNRGNPLSFVLGRDINGSIIFCNLDKMPHVLVAGSTGSGKSVCLNTMLLSMCYKAGPQDLRLILVDPKMVEFTQYNGLPHLLIPEVITNKDMTINALDWAIKEMDRRYGMFAKNRVVNIVEFNKSEAVRFKREDKLPYIVIVVDELADLMLDAKREIDDRINKLAAKARAAGIHLVLATQRPSVDVITGTVKANLPSRIAFALTNFMDSKTILDASGAEKLLGKGDMLFKPQDKPEPMRVQGAYVSNSEIYQVVEFIKENNKPVYDEDAGREIKNPQQKSQSVEMMGGKESEFDPVLKDALKWFIQVKQASGSMISRRFSVGFNRAGRIMDQMEQAGFIGPQEGSKPRQVLITMDEYKAIFGDNE